MKKIIKLTESDLARIVRRVIMEDEDPKAQSCSDLDNKEQHVVRNMTQRSYLTVGKGTTMYGSRSGKDPNIEDKKDIVKVTEQDPYAYVQLFNGKYCVTKPTPGSSVYGKWIEATSSGQKSAIWNILQKNPTPEYLRGA
jgi:hypothetical protein